MRHSATSDLHTSSWDFWFFVANRVNQGQSAPKSVLRTCGRDSYYRLVLSYRIIVSYYRLVVSSRSIVSYYRLVMCCVTLCIMSRVAYSTSCTMSCGLSLNRCIHCHPIVMLSLCLSLVDMLSTMLSTRWSTDDFCANTSRLTSLTFRVRLFG